MRTVLVVDDEQLIATLIRRTLEPQYAVCVAHSGEAALEQVRGGARFDVIVTDLHMEHGDGVWLHDQIAALDAAQSRRMVFLSGAPHRFLQQPGVRSVPKPFRSAELIAQIEAAATS